jgi:hypothetical protein
MKATGRDKFTWRDNQLFYAGRKLARVVPNDEVPGMYWIVRPNGDVSADHYNLTRAKQNAITTEMRRLNAAQKGQESPPEAPGFVLPLEAANDPSNDMETAA